MRRSGTGSGGGIGMNKNVRPPVVTGTGSHSTRAAGTNKFGYSVGDHVTNRGDGTGYRGERLHNPEKNFQPVPFGNAVALNVKGGGPGTGRTNYGQSGSQGCHGQPAQGAGGLPSTKGQWPDAK
jgi:hypothetical protein